MKIVRLASALAALTLSAATAVAQSEGIAEMKGSVRSERGETMSMQTRAYVSKAGGRVEMTMDLSQMAARKDRSSRGVPAVHKEVLLYRTAEPGITYMLNVERKTYSVFQAPSPEKSEGKAAEPFTVTRLGRDSVAGFSCEKALVKRTGSGDEMELCVSKDIGAPGAWLDAINRRQRAGSLFKALSDAGLTGFPIRWIVRRSGEKEPFTTLELTRFERTSVPASTFEIPAGYRKVSGGEVHMTREQEEAMKKALENMTPEQRKQFEEMMKKQKGEN
jgi:hypothetical protein